VLVAAGLIGAGDDSVDVYRSFPPLQESTITDTSYLQLDKIAEHVAGFVLANFPAVTACANATDACAAAYLDSLATRAYRRSLTPDEKARFTALYSRLRAPQIVNGYEVTFTVQEATSYAVQALLGSPQMLWRWEIGDPAMASGAPGPAGIPLTDHELATHLAFFLTDRPPDDTMLAAANAGTLRANLAVHVDRLLASQVGRDWLRTIMETYFGLNRVPEALVDTAKFPLFSPALTSDMSIEARKFLDHALWNGNLTDLLLSRTAFLNAGLATSIYMVPVPPGATQTNFVQTMLPAERSGLLTNAAFAISRSHPDGRGLVVPRGKFVAAALLCMPTPAFDHPYPDLKPIPPPPQTAQEEAASRAAIPLCRQCHAELDPYGLALENYDVLGRYRTTDDLGQPVDAHTTLPAAIGGDAVANGVELAQALATTPAFTNCMANAVLQYAMVDLEAYVQVPLPPQQAGCATAAIVDRYRNVGSKTFADLVRATTASPAFVLRRAAP
jgi:hypothetical protein